MRQNTSIALGVFRSCFHEALASLSPRERNLLRLRFVDGVAVADIATLYQ